MHLRLGATSSYFQKQMRSESDHVAARQQQSYPHLLKKYSTLIVLYFYLLYHLCVCGVHTSPPLLLFTPRFSLSLCLSPLCSVPSPPLLLRYLSPLPVLLFPLRRAGARPPLSLWPRRRRRMHDPSGGAQQQQVGPGAGQTNGKRSSSSSASRRQLQSPTAPRSSHPPARGQGPGAGAAPEEPAAGSSCGRSVEEQGRQAGEVSGGAAPGWRIERLVRRREGRRGGCRQGVAADACPVLFLLKQQRGQRRQLPMAARRGSWRMMAVGMVRGSHTTYLHQI